MNASRFTELRSVIADTMRVAINDVALDSTNENLAGWDSLSHLNLIGAIEKEFDVRFEKHEVMDCLSVADLLAAIEAKTATVPATNQGPVAYTLTTELAQ